MKARAWLIAMVASVVMAAVTGGARADVPPAPDSDDAHCSEEEQCAGGAWCDYARSWSSPGAKQENDESAAATDACIAKATKAGLEYRCRDGSNYSGRQLYCPKGGTGTFHGGGKSAGKSGSGGSGGGAPKKGACACNTPGSARASSLEGSLIVGLVVLASLRRARRRAEAPRDPARRSAGV